MRLVVLTFNIQNKYESQLLRKLHNLSSSWDIIAVGHDVSAFAQCKGIATTQMIPNVSLIPTDHDEVLPQFTMEAMNHLLDRGIISPSETVLVLDGRYAHSSVDIITKARKKYSACGLPLLISLAPTKDNPVQYDAYHLFASVTFLCKANKDKTGKEFWQSDPFGFPWHEFGYGACSSGTLFHFPPLNDLGTTEKMKPLAEIPLRIGILLELVDSNHAIRHLPFQQCETSTLDLCGFTVTPGLTDLDCFIENTPQGVALFLAEELACPGATVHMRSIHAMGCDVTFWKGGIFWSVDSVQKKRRTLHGQDFIGPFPMKDLPESTQVLTVLHPVNECGAADIIEPLLLKSELWKYDSDTKMRICNETTNMLSGRQTFPDFFIPVPVLSIGRYSDFMYAKDHLLAGEVSGMILNKNCYDQGN